MQTKELGTEITEIPGISRILVQETEDGSGVEIILTMEGQAPRVYNIHEWRNLRIATDFVMSVAEKYEGRRMDRIEGSGHA